MIRENFNIQKIFLFFIGLIGIHLFVYYFISQEKYIYFWDYFHYWYKFQNVGTALFTKPLEELRIIYHTVRHDDYNLLPVFFLSPFYLFFGADRLSYILAIADIYVFSSAILLVFLTGKFISMSQQKNSIAASMLSLMTFILLPQVWIPVLYGYPDIAGVTVIIIILLIWMRKPLEDQKWTTLVGLGLLLSFLVMLRRWYAYWTVSFFIAIAADMLITVLPKHRAQVARYVPYLKNMFIIGSVSVLSFFSVASPIAKKMLTTNYADIYSAYKRSPDLSRFFSVFFDDFGLLEITLCLAGMVCGILNKKTRRLSLFLLIQMISIILLFTRVQDFNSHHYYLIIPVIVIFISLSVITFLHYLKSIPVKLSFLAIYLLVFIVQFSVVFVPKASDYFAKITPLFPKSTHYPLVRNDLQKIDELLDVLKELLKGESTVYVLSSSMIFNSDIVKNACLSSYHAGNLCEQILESSDVDKIHGFPMNFLNADYIVLASPNQYHLNPDDQRVIGVLADEIRNPKNIGVSYEQLPFAFALDDNVTVSIYKKVRPLRKSDLAALEDIFLGFYPNRKDIFTIADKNDSAQ
jgi:hypothetical protein